MDVGIISKEFIKPSSPTPNHLKTYKLSLLDQFTPSVYVPMILFYQMNHDKSLDYTDIISARSQLLKQSLSETMTRFYPMAGRVKDEVSIDCNDEGAYYIEAKVDCPLSEFLNQPDDLSLLNKFLPDESNWKEPSPGSYITMLQITNFACGSFVIGVFVSHMIVDGTALSSFLKCWAATARKSCDEAMALYPNFDASFIFPQNNDYTRDGTLLALCSPFFKVGRCATRRFVFDAAAMATLKAKATSSSVPNPTRVEVVTALISKCVKATLKKPLLISHAVNMRRRALPPFPETCMGNFLWIARAESTGQPTEGLVCSLREAITKINGDFVKKLQGDGGFQNLRENIKEMQGLSFDGYDQLMFSSWCNFGLYEIDFGCGKPTWASCVGSTKSESVFMNTVVLVDTRSGDGIDAWIYLAEEDMQVLEHDEELLECASFESKTVFSGQFCFPILATT